MEKTRIAIHLTPSQRAELETAATLLGYATLSEWARVTLLDAARRTTKELAPAD